MKFIEYSPNHFLNLDHVVAMEYRQEEGHVLLNMADSEKFTLRNEEARIIQLAIQSDAKNHAPSKT
jgi:hypothetical protein